MRLRLTLVTATLLAGCSTVSTVREAWYWDPTAPQARTHAVIAPDQAAALTSRLAVLQTQRTEIRSRISAEPDIRVRQRLYEDLHRVGRQLSPLERQMMAATPR